jgi:hypothetical protein
MQAIKARKPALRSSCLIKGEREELSKLMHAVCLKYYEAKNTNRSDDRGPT